MQVLGEQGWGSECRGYIYWCLKCLPTRKSCWPSPVTLTSCRHQIQLMLMNCARRRFLVGWVLSGMTSHERANRALVIVLQARQYLSRPDPCSVDFGPETPKFRFENCRGFLGGFFPPFFPRKKARKNPPKNPPKNSLGTLFRKIPLGFLQKPFLDIWGFEMPFKVRVVEASKLVSTKALLLKHYYRRQGLLDNQPLSVLVLWWEITGILRNAMGLPFPDLWW